MTRVAVLRVAISDFRNLEKIYAFVIQVKKMTF